ncbi:PTS fructose transporter subunit IIB [Halobellus inordinatus]|uniref:PTS fructose transporter subunit IIB n=1 Tax=Halobellus inordinatus TaxID=1126236 RepID=UPI0021086F94|nr:PTS fructose transporter subunit IIB [Halobellus inordinatus]
MNVVAVTSCPTGIAHCQMAAENLERTGERLGHEIKVEVQGAVGTQNEVTAAEIDDADAVIIAADTAVSRDRFEGKPLVGASVKDGVDDPEDLFEHAVDLVEAGETRTIEVGGGSGGESDASVGANGATAGTASDATEDDSGRRGGDRGQGLLARIKKLFS